MISWPSRRARAAVLSLSLWLVPAWVTHAERDVRPSLLLGGGAAAAPASVPVDPRLPKGALIEAEPRPTSASVACGLREPVCVHHDASLSDELVQAYLRALEQGWLELVHALGLPPPLPDLGRGPTPGLDLYLTPAAPLDVQVAADRGTHPEDRRSAFCRARPSRAQARRQALRCVAEALQLGVDAAETPFSRAAVSAYLWHLLGAPGGRDLDAIDRVQANPQLSIAGRDASAESPGGALFFEYVDARLGAGEPGLLPVALAQLGRTRTPPGQLRWSNEPDMLDVLREAFSRSSTRFEDFLLGFAVERAFLGSRDDGRHHQRLGWLGDAGRVRFDWVIPASSLPRRVAPRRPLEAFGCAYTWIELDRVTLGKALALRAEWEAPAAFRWALVTVDGSGHVLGRYDLPYLQNATSAERTLTEYDGAAGVLIAGINLGGIDLAHPFDPDHEPTEPHGFTLYVAEL